MPTVSYKFYYASNT